MKLQKNIKNIAIRTLLNESEAIKKLTTLLDDNFDRCIEEILHCKGRIVVTGIGKSAIIANKIVATLNSTGTPALFLHAADAIHGDLGMILPDDIVLCLSKSGNTPEIKVLVPLLKRKGAKLIAMVGNIDSFLATHADYVLNASIDKEACPHNLAPTTSTTVSLALGDAVAVCLMELRSFGKEDFAQRHPGGSLGKKLYLKVDDIYPNNEVPIVSPDATLDEVIIEISSKRLGVTAVVDGQQKLLGVITDGDIRRMLKNKVDITSAKATEIMTVSPKTISTGTFAAKALMLMQENNITQLLVEEDGKMIGVVHLHDLLKEGLI